MKQLDVYYRALLLYREQTAKNRECGAQRSAIANVNTESDRIVLTRKICTVEEDWVNAIEQGLVFIDKAIKEDRQFIRSNGEVVPIEKVKNVSKDSVTHLAKHSNLITRQTEGEDIIPDHLYTVERLNDYAVYENRFLYMLLCYLRDFITLRYNKILELSNTYSGSMTMNKTVKHAKQTVQYEVKLNEERRDDKYLREHNEAREIIDRIDLLLKAVLAFLSTPLMEDVSKAPMLKPPITKTNVLKMNNNFKQAMALYSFVVAYDRDGYSVETRVSEISPFRDEIADEMAETILLSSFLTYEHSLGLEKMLKESYDRAERERKTEEYRKQTEKLEQIRRRLEKSEVPVEEYVLMLEKQIRTLEKRCEDLDRTYDELCRTKDMLAASQSEAAELRENLTRTCEELADQKQKYIDDMAAQKAEYEALIEEMRQTHEAEMLSLRESYEAEIERIRSEYEATVEAMREAHANEIAQLREAHASEIRELNQSHANEIAELNARHAEEIEIRKREIEALQQQNAAEKEAHIKTVALIKSEAQEAITKLNEEKDALQKESEQKTEAIRVIKARLLALRHEHGMIAEDDHYTSKQRFDELEHTFKVFQKFYKSEWARAKKKIRKDLLHTKPTNQDQKTDKGVGEE